MSVNRDASRHGQQTFLEQDPHARREEDLYETFRWQTAALLRRLPGLNPQWTYVEPCAGNGAIVKMIATEIGRQGEAHIWSNDIAQRNWPLHSQGDASDRLLWDTIAQNLGGIDVTITNLPFGVAFPIIQLAWEYSRVAVITLLRHTWDEPTIDRNEWLAAHPLTAKIVMPRAKYRGGSGQESATHSWFIWVKDQEQLDPESAGGQFALLQAHDTVTIKECMDLAIQYGEDPATISGWTGAAA